MVARGQGFRVSRRDCLYVVWESATPGDVDFKSSHFLNFQPLMIWLYYFMLQDLER